MTHSRLPLTIVGAVILALGLSTSPAAAQTVTTNIPTQVASGQEWATVSMQDPIDMNQWTDISWWAYAVDQPTVDLAGVTQGECTATTLASPAGESGSVCFKAANDVGAGKQPNLWVLETPNGVSADIHKNGTNFPINADVYTMFAVRMRLTNSGTSCVAVSATTPPAPGLGCNVSLLWNTTSLYDGAAATQTNAVPTYEGWGIYFINISTIGASGPKPWSGTIRDLRLNLQNIVGSSVEIDWIRLVPNNLTSQRITWSGFGATQVDIYLDNDASGANGNLGLIMQNADVSRYKGVTSGLTSLGNGTFDFQPAALAPGTYYVVLCPSGNSPTSGCTYAASPFVVNDIPRLTFTSPSPEGSSDDFATTVLGNAWDMNALTDIDFYANSTTGAASQNTGLAVATVTGAVNEAGTSLGNIQVIQAAGSATVGAAAGDPYMYPLWFAASPVPGRGQTNKIDANKYHILTLEAGIPNKARDINGGSVIRMVWQVTGERNAGNPRENVSQDIIFNHRAGYNVLNTITADMKTLRLETDPGASPSTSGWTSTIESFRFDAHEFAASTGFFVKRIKLAANERTTTTYNIQWTYTDTISGGTPTLTLSYDTDNNATNGFAGTIATGLNPTALSYNWNTQSPVVVPNGTYYIYAAFSDGTSSNGSYSRWPIIVGPLNGLSATPTSLRIIATKSGATLPFKSPPQEVTVTMTGTQAAWTATANQTWISVINGSGTGGGRFSVEVVNPNDVIGTNEYLSGTVTVTSASTGLSTVVPVNLRIKPGGTSDPPTGGFDTPVTSVTAVAGSFAVSGWALDDIGINRVEIWRDLVAGETTPPYPGPGLGTGKVFIANGLFVSGARPDIEQGFNEYPFSSRAGWGYLLLSWGLWNQGNGPFTLHAFAYDQEGNGRSLGSKQIVVSNATAVRPFGGIDVPSYGGTVNGTFYNFGWALTPNATPTCTITNGNVSVAIDSGALTPVSFGDLRTDIAGAFPGFSNGNNSGGNFLIDSSTLTNGTHQIGWYVVDNCGRADGVGSRFFQVLNSAARTVPTDGAVVSARMSAPAASTATDAPIVPSAETGPVQVQRHDRDWHLSYPNAEGTRIIGLELGERIEVQLPAVDGATYAGKSMVAGVPNALPLGSSLDAQAGVFYWEPGPGFLGTFDLQFVATSRREQRTTAVRVVVGPAMRSVIDTPSPNSVVQQPFLVGGWAADLAADEGTGVDTVHVWAYPADGSNPRFLGVASIGDPRADIAAAYGQQFEGAAFNLMAMGLKPGVYDLVVYPHRTETNSFEGATVVRITVR